MAPWQRFAVSIKKKKIIISFIMVHFNSFRNLNQTLASDIHRQT